MIFLHRNTLFFVYVSGILIRWAGITAWLKDDCIRYFRSVIRLYGVPSVYEKWVFKRLVEVGCILFKYCLKAASGLKRFRAFYGMTGVSVFVALFCYCE